jgi:hypothetical protein
MAAASTWNPSGTLNLTPTFSMPIQITLSTTLMQTESIIKASEVLLDRSNNFLDLEFDWYHYREWESNHDYSLAHSNHYPSLRNQSYH